ncbi:MAG: 6-bladed beta-propeller [Candidatus Nitrospinota bacterium M3_3B_026]
MSKAVGAGLCRRSFLGALAALLVLLGAMSACTTTVEVPEFKPPVFPPPPDPPKFYWERMLRSSADIKREDTEDMLRRMVTGQRRPGLGIAKPYGVAVHQGRVFVGDTVSRQVYAYDFVDGRFFEVGDDDGPGVIYKPLGLATDGAGNLYVVDATSKNVKIFNRDGEYITTVGVKGDLERPTGVAATPDGRKVFVVDTGGVLSENHRVRVYNPATGKHLYDFGSRGTGPGQFNLPNNAAIGPDGTLYVVDGGNFRVQVLTQEGEFIRAIGQIGRQFGQFSRPKGIGVDKDNNVYVADAAFGNFQIFDKEGRLLLFVGSRGKGGGPAEYFLPAGLAVDEDGRVYMVDQYFRKVGIYRPAHLEPNEGYLAGNPVGKQPEALK